MEIYRVYSSSILSGYSDLDRLTITTFVRINVRETSVGLTPSSNSNVSQVMFDKLTSSQKKYSNIPLTNQLFAVLKPHRIHDKFPALLEPSIEIQW